MSGEEFEYAETPDDRARVIAQSDQDYQEAWRLLRDAHREHRLWMVAIQDAEGADTVTLIGGGNGSREDVIGFHGMVLEGVSSVIVRTDESR